MCTIAIIDFNKFILGKTNCTNIILRDKWFEESSIINYNLNSQKLYLITKNCINKRSKLTICSLNNNSIINKQKFNLKDIYFDMNIFEYKNKVYSGSKKIVIFEKSKDFNLKIENILDNKDCFNINLKNVLNLWDYEIIEEDKLFIVYGDNIRPITSCIYNRLNNSVKYIKGTVAPVSLHSKELVFIE
ncbi:hypothetical protein DP144_10075 [Clostridium tetani]|uniref:hypothetical protein n=2 Tax=Clostridium tetani TaxID=1513 RepID=UPI00100BA447|nr:hypothetical protein [Clostridium tetani]RXM58498.1 hypothetical protein DP133_04735 [Clostridium tetani]RXM75100.1 hypothetical protein DP154_10855 [Clostridium tetani]RYU98369.1 hypothetical protein DP144_10075 [Clostridium tetani]BDR76211.1 hypothetical protein K154306013_18710 [Clostridium tetani]